MCEKAVVLEIKDDYCLVMTEEGSIVRILKKSGIREGQKIYILEEDLYCSKDFVKGSAVLPFFSREKDCGSGNSGCGKRKAIMTKILTAAAAFLIFVGTLSLPQLSDPAYAAVSFDGEKSVQLRLDDENRVISAKSYDETVNKDVLSDMEGCRLEELWDVLRDFSGEDEPVLVAGAPLKRRAEEDTEALWEEICENLNESICLRGEKKDVREADKQNKSLGIYLLEKAVDEDALAEYFGAEQGEKLAVFLKKHQEKMPQIYRKYVQLSEAGDDDAEDFEQDQDEADDEEIGDESDDSRDDDEDEKPGGSVVKPQNPDDEDSDAPSEDGNEEASDADDEDENGDSDEEEDENEDDNEEESRDERI